MNLPRLASSLAVLLLPLTTARAITSTLDLSGVKEFPAGISWVAEGPKNAPALKIDIPAAQAAGEHLYIAALDMSVLRGKQVLLSYDVRAENVSDPALDYHGIKCQLHTESVSEGPRWFSEKLPTGSFDWRRSEILLRIDDDVTKGELQLGLQDVSGTVWISNITLSVVGEKPARPTRLRGIMSPFELTPGLFDEFAAWKVNIVRWQLVNADWPRDDVPQDPRVYAEWLGAKLDELAAALESAKATGIKVIIDLHTPPGGRLTDGTQRVVMDKGLQKQFLETWRAIAKRFRGHPAVWAYDLMNEPVQTRPSPPGVLDWWELQAAVAKEVRAVDPDTTILISSDDWDSPQAFAWLRPVWVPNVVYQVHMYWPYEYTHQGFDKPWEPGKDAIPYPGTWNGRPLDRAALERHLAPVREFQRAYGARILVGEFSVVRWAPGAARYLSDAISLFEDYGWDWIYHAYRERSAWDLEHANLPHESQTPVLGENDRSAVVRGWFERNR